MKHIVVSDSRQSYTYILTEPAGKNFDPEFRPDLTPRQMLELGVFGGNYFTGEYQELPPAWLQHAVISDHGHDPALNFFAIDASQPLRFWEERGWIFEEDPRGWFQWYCRYYMGRRLPEVDRQQIKRWKAMRRHIAQIKKACHPGDLNCRPRQRQALLHWAYDSRSL